MTYPDSVTIDSRDADAVLQQLLQRRVGYVPEWAPHGAGLAIAGAHARYLAAVIDRLNRVPFKNKLAFLDLLGIQPIPARAARAPLVFKLADKAVDGRMPAGAQIAAPPPPERTDQLVFETERALGLAAAHIVQVVSLWPGRDQYIDHTADVVAANPIRLFATDLLQDTPHHLYVAHDTLLALAGRSRVDVSVELSTSGNERLDVTWEYWDGEVWRQFRNMGLGCDDQTTEPWDGTAGLTRSGRYRLETDCAETSKTKVSGIEAYWIRGRLTEPLPPDPAQILPEVESIKLSSVVERPLTASLSGTKEDSDGEHGADDFVLVRDASGAPLRGIAIFHSSGTAVYGATQTDAEGTITFRPGPRPAIVTASVPSLATAAVEIGATAPAQDVVFTLDVNGLIPDSALSDLGNVDLTKPFFPLGQQPLPGAAFYFTHQEAFAKPGAKLQVFVQTALTPSDQVGPSQTTIAAAGSSQLQHTVAWEYWNGKVWAGLVGSQGALNYTGQDTAVLAFTRTGLAEITIPADIAPTKVNDQAGLWMRIRLVSGTYGFIKQIPLTSAGTFDVVIQQPPALSKFLLGYRWESAPVYAEHVLTFNDFAYEDRTHEAQWPGESFLPFRRLADATPAAYLGFDQALPVDRLGLYFGVVENEADPLGPAMQWEYWDGSTWERIDVEDDTQNLRIPGIVSLIGAQDSVALDRFGIPRHWLRARLKEDGPPGEPTLDALALNAVWASQHRTVVDESVGTSTAQPNQQFSLSQIPVLDEVLIEVRELAGARANVEWPLLALEVLQDETQVQTLDKLCAKEGTQSEIEFGPLRLKRDRNKRVTEAWVLWQEQPHFFASGKQDRHYTVERARGRLAFGDGVQGRVPPLDAAIRARRYRSGGGSSGNTAAGTVTQLIAPIGGVEKVYNPRPAEGGADGEGMDRYALRGPQALRALNRSIVAADYETLAYEASAAVAFARAVPNRSPWARDVPGWVTLLIVPQSAEPRPLPSFGLREEVRQYIEERAPAGLGTGQRIYVTGPDYQPVDVALTIVPADASSAGVVEQAVRDALLAFLQPTSGGPEGRGWQLGRDLFASDIASVVEAVDGVDFVDEIALSSEGPAHVDRIAIAADRLLVAGDLRLKLKVED